MTVVMVVQVEEEEEKVEVTQMVVLHLKEIQEVVLDSLE